MENENFFYFSFKKRFFFFFFFLRNRLSFFFYFQDSYGSIAVRPATKEKRLQNHLQKDNARENVRDLVRRIRFIKSRLDRAESDFRKKRMLKAIVGLRKKVKSLIEGMRNNKAEQGKSQQKTGASCLHKKVDNSKETAQENNKNMNAGSIVISATDGKLVTDQVIVNIGKLLFYSFSFVHIFQLNIVNFCFLSF